MNNNTELVSKSIWYLRTSQVILIALVVGEYLKYV